MFKHSLALVESKGHDYNFEQQRDGNTLFNLEVCQLLGIVDYSTQGILVRLADKLMRLISLTKDPFRLAAVKDETVEDTIGDIHNFVDYLGILYEKARGGRH
jgi:hypothetical protein